MTDSVSIQIVGDGPYTINPSNTKRDWMGDTQNSHAYRCLPMTSANSHGWTINLNEECVVEWDGTENQQSVTVLSGAGEENVAGGFVTFRFPYIFTTPPEYYLWCSGQPNYARNDMVPLNAIIRSDWYPASFQFTWKLTKPGRIVFEKGMPIMFFMPYPKALIENVDIELYSSEPSREKQIRSALYGKSIMESFLRKQKNEDSWKEWDGLYRTGKVTNNSEKIVDDAMWVPRPNKPKRK